MRRPVRLLSLPTLLALGTLAIVAGVATVCGFMWPAGDAAAVAVVPSGDAVSDASAVSLLEQAYRAGTTLPYQGEAFVGTDGVFVNATVHHVPGRGTYVSAQGAAPSGTQALFEPDGDHGLDPLRLLQDHYTIVYGGTATRAGRATWVVRADRVDGSCAARFWIDQQTHLVLARSAYDEQSRAYEEMQFTEVSVGAADGAADKRADAAVTSFAATIAARADRLRADGWHVAESLPGGFDLYDARVSGSGEDAVLHLSYSDGLSTISVFEQRGRLLATALAGWRRTAVGGRSVYVDDAAASRLAWQGHDLVFALIGDAAPRRVAAAVAALPHGGAGDGVFDRLQRGFARVGSWLDPF